MEVESHIVPSALRGINENWESDLLSTCLRGVNGVDKTTDLQTVNGADHRFMAGATGTEGIIRLEDISYMKYAFDKANVPDEGRIAVVTPEFEYWFNNELAGNAFTSDAQWIDFVDRGFSRNRKFITNMFGFDIWVSNRLPAADATGLAAGGAGSVAGTANVKANLFQSVADDMSKPFMSAWRRQPRVEGTRKVEKRRDEFHVTARWGHETQREETYGVIYTNDSI